MFKSNKHLYLLPLRLSVRLSVFVGLPADELDTIKSFSFVTRYDSPHIFTTLFERGVPFSVSLTRGHRKVGVVSQCVSISACVINFGIQMRYVLVRKYVLPNWYRRANNLCKEGKVMFICWYFCGVI